MRRVLPRTHDPAAFDYVTTTLRKAYEPSETQDVTYQTSGASDVAFLASFIETVQSPKRSARVDVEQLLRRTQDVLQRVRHLIQSTLEEKIDFEAALQEAPALHDEFRNIFSDYVPLARNPLSISETSITRTVKSAELKRNKCDDPLPSTIQEKKKQATAKGTSPVHYREIALPAGVPIIKRHAKITEDETDISTERPPPEKMNARMSMVALM